MNRILAIDIGHGTKDVLLYDSTRTLENCVKAVVRAPAKRYAERVLSRPGDLDVVGDTVGGGPLAYALRELVKQGHRVRTTSRTCFLVRNCVEDVRKDGIEVADDLPEGSGNGTRIHLDEMEIPALRDFLHAHDEDLENLDAVAFAVQDHGAYKEGELNRVSRFRTFAERLSENPHPSALAFTRDDLPSGFYRMQSGLDRLAKDLPGVPALAADTPMSALMGCRAELPSDGVDLLVNVGNCHLMAGVFRGDRVLSAMEHHTRMFRKRASELGDALRRFADGDFSDEQVREDGGEGAVHFDPPGFHAVERILVTGPNRGLLLETDLDTLFPAPGGDMMMTGPLGLLRFAERLLGTS
ncbi:MAG: DUF1786 family protein [Candidatus Krumholzibacteria bacterium]|jgi:uncharacterized protein (DUF1786 family)|nr:DUF1786 family protein [Gemmatimonadota bacterium]MDP6796956.1 DUF1786 family protein [Candidatus Krumholzibacteria bacterium]MDP7021968.1 DUF1786 family protein [Candidatus Krumholzibacteria bacterium]